jgi:DNA repair photolyase
MAYYSRNYLGDSRALSVRRPTINDFFLSSYMLSVYLGCEIGCPYCDSWTFSQRPLNETVGIPLDLPQRLREHLAEIDRGDLIAINVLSDAYQPAEQTYRITRQTLQVLFEHRQPCMILTKGTGVVEDIPLLQRFNEQSLALVMFTLLTVDQALAEKLESKAPPAALRLEAIAELKRAGIPVGVAAIPIMPYVNDSHHAFRSLVRACVAAGADFIVWDYLHIPNERHRARINDMLARVGSYPTSYYRDIYQDRATVSNHYRRDRDQIMLDICDGMGIEPRAPRRIFTGKLSLRNEIALILKHSAYRDRVQGRTTIADQHSQLADRIYHGEIPEAELRQSPLYPDLRTLLEALKGL